MRQEERSADETDVPGDRTPLNKENRKVGRKHGDGGVPNRFLLAGIRIFLFLYFLRFRLVVDRSEMVGIKPPYILMGNHGSNLDAFLVARCLKPYRMNYVTSAFFYRFGLLRVLLRCAGAIPKARTQKDLKALRLMMQTLSSGRILMVFPEGRRSMDGTGSRFTEAMAKLAKRSGVPVVVAHIEGSYLSWPRWATHARPGTVTLRLYPLWMPEALKTASVTEIHQRMHEALRFDDYAGLRGSAGVAAPRYRCRKPAQNIQWLLHACPDCREEMVIRGEGNTVVCTACGARAEMRSTGALQRISGKDAPWPDVPAWFTLQRAILAEKMRDPHFSLESPVFVSRTESSPDSAMRALGMGVARLSMEGMTVVGSNPETPFSASFSMGELDMLPVSLGHQFEVCDGESVYWQLCPERLENVVRFEQYVDICLYGAATDR